MRVIDLSLPICEGSVTFPGMQKAVILQHVTHGFSASNYEDPCKGFASFQLIINDHTGTHIDAPFHMCPDKGRLDTVRLEKLIGEAVLLDFSFLPVDKEITCNDLEEYVEAKNLTIKEGDIVIIRKWPGHWGTEGYFDCKALSECAAEWLLGKKVNAVGIDLATVDVEGKPMKRRAHIKLLSNEVYIIENLVNLDKIPENRFNFVAMPLSIEGISGSPTRAIAIL